LDINDFKCDRKPFVLYPKAKLVNSRILNKEIKNWIKRRVEQVSCAIRNTCPRGCTCDRNTVDCSSLGLRAIPTDIPPTTKWLDLKDNKIDNLTPITELQDLEHLDLSKNSIPGKSSKSLQLLIMSHNYYMTHIDDELVWQEWRLLHLIYQNWRDYIWQITK